MVHHDLSVTPPLYGRSLQEVSFLQRRSAGFSVGAVQLPGGHPRITVPTRPNIFRTKIPTFRSQTAHTAHTAQSSPAQLLPCQGSTAVKIPWEDLRYIFGEIMYGGTLTLAANLAI